MGISNLSDVDFISIVANYNDATDGAANRVAPEAANRGYTPAQLALAMGKLTERFKPVESCNLRFTKPFGDVRYDLLGYALTLFDNYERGQLPFPGAVTDQPGQIMDIFSVLRQLKFETEVKSRNASPRTKK